MLGKQIDARTEVIESMHLFAMRSLYVPIHDYLLSKIWRKTSFTTSNSDLGFHVFVYLINCKEC